MKVLVITERFPYPPSNGGMLRTHHLIRGVAERHRVEIVCFSNEEPVVPYANATVKRVAPQSFTSGHRAIALLQPMPVYPLANHTRSMSDLIQTICRRERPDICHVDTLGMAGYVHELSIPVVVDLMDCVSLHYERLARIQTNPLRRALYSFERLKIVRFERKVAKSASALICCTKEDADCVKAITHRDVLTIGNGVVIPEAIPAKSPAPPVIVFLGFLEYPPNRDAVQFFGDEIWPRVLEIFPGARFEIVGKGPTVALRSMKNIRFRGYVEDLASAYGEASVMVAPIRAGSGIKNKVLEAMAYGVPVVATTLGVEGVGGTDGQHYLVADTPESFIASIQRLLSAPALSLQIGQAGREFVRRKFDWTRAVSQLLATYETVLKGS
jgi:glycosyltransferase involved in cell wall biosynthesis